MTQLEQPGLHHQHVLRRTEQLCPDAAREELELLVVRVLAHVRKETLEKLRRPWFAGGTVNFATVQGRTHVLAPREAKFEDDTLNYLAIPAVRVGLQYLERVGIETIHARVNALTGWLLKLVMMSPLRSPP